MSQPRCSVLLGLATTALVGSPLAVQAASIDLDSLALIKSRPIESSNFLSFFGDIDDNQGQTVFLNINPIAPDGGHFEISKNSNRPRAPYYATGRNASPVQTGATRATTLNGLSGFSNVLNYLNANNIDSSELGFGYGQKDGLDPRQTWNLGEDEFGQDWFGDPNSTIGERIYQANPTDVESFLTLGDTKFVTFGYSPLYVVFDFGPTDSFDDTFDLFFSDPIGVNKVVGLDPLAEGLANAFLKDVNTKGNRVQLVVEDLGAPDSDLIFTPIGSEFYAVANVRFPLSIRVVQVSESSYGWGLLLFGALGIVAQFPKRNTV